MFIPLTISVNACALNLVKEMMSRADQLNVTVERMSNGGVYIDAGVKSHGGYLAGKYLAEICMGGLGTLSFTALDFDGLTIPSVTVTTDHPAISLLGSQFAGWRISVDKYFAMGSGPARALSLKPKELYAKINYRDECDVAIIVFETSEKPSEQIVNFIAKECNVKPDGVYIIAAATSSVAGSTQISGRILETGLHKLGETGMDVNKVIYGSGQAPIATIHPKFTHAMGRTNDVLLYGGTVFFIVDFENEDELVRLAEKAPSSASKDYGKPFQEIFKEAGNDFYKIDPSLFAPGVFIINNLRTGKVFKFGRLDPSILKKSLGFSS